MPRPTPEAVLIREIAAAGAAVEKATTLVQRRVQEQFAAHAALAEANAVKSAAQDRLARAEAALVALRPTPVPAVE